MRFHAALFAVFLVFAGTPAFPAAPEFPPEGQALTPPADDAELSHFVDAFVSLVGLRHGTIMQLQAEPDPDRREEIKTEALMAMTGTVEQHGLTVDRYNEIAMALQSDAALQDRVGALLQQLAESAPSDSNQE